MGFFSSNASDSAGQLAPVSHPIGVLAEYTRHTSTVALKIREKKISMSGDDFSVNDAVTNQRVFKVDGRVFSIRDSKKIKDANGNSLFKLKQKLVAIHTTYIGEDANSGEELFTVKSSWGITPKLTASFKNRAGHGEDCKLVLKGDFFDRKATIKTESGETVAQISRSFLNAGQVFFDKQSYVLTVAPSVDISLLLAITICLDEKTNDSDDRD